MAMIPRVPPELFRFSAGDRAEVYTAILHAFAEANERLETSLGLDDVRSRLRSVGWFDALADEDLLDMLRQLQDWRLLDVMQNHAAQYRTAEEYERRNLQYSLTRHGEAAVAGIERALTVLTSTGALQTAVLEAIADRLGDLAELSEDTTASDRRVFVSLQELEGHLDGLRNNTKQFNGELQRLLRADGADLDTFREVKAATVVYLQDFISNLDQRVFAITNALLRLDGPAVDRLHDRALLGAQLPSLGQEDPGPLWLAHRRSRWAGLLAWFRPADGSSARVDQLHDVARRAIVALLQVLDRLSEARRRSSSAVSDYRELARWFALAPAEDDLHRLWAAAFGLSSARHAHLAHPDPELVPAGTDWVGAGSVPVSPLLRSAGSTARFSRTGQVRDVSAVRTARAARARRQRTEVEAAWELLDTRASTRLSKLGPLDHEVFQRLLELLGRALSAPADAQGRRQAATGDGRVEIVLWPPEQDDRRAILRTPAGRLTVPDYTVDIAVDGVRADRHRVRA